MIKRIFILLVIAYASYSVLVYAYGNRGNTRPSSKAIRGFAIWQDKNCQACHQIYGLGGYMGPDLTNIISDSTRGPLYATAFLQAGSLRMPNFNFTETEISELLAFLSWVDKSGKSFIPDKDVTWYGNYNLDK